MNRPRPRVVIATASAPDIGYGHVVRLGAVLAAMNSSIAVCCDGDAARFFAGHETLTAAELELAVRRGERIVLVVDHPDRRRWRSFADAPDVLAVALDDDGGPDVRANLVVNCSGFPGHHRYPSLPEGAVVRAGFDYIPLRVEFQGLPLPEGPFTGVAIVAGSSMPVQTWVTRLVEFEFPSAWQPVVVVVSHAYPAQAVVKARRAGTDIRQGITASELVASLRSKQVSVLTAGMAMFEAFAAGVPVAAYPVQANMRDECRYYQDQGLLFDLGEAAAAPHSLIPAVDDILARGTARDAAYRARQRVDGRGARRIAALIEAMAAAWSQTTNKALALSAVDEGADVIHD